MATGSLKDRVEVLEVEVVRLRAKVDGAEKRSDQPWWEKIAGTFAGDPTYLEAMRLGREYRESLCRRAINLEKQIGD